MKDYNTKLKSLGYELVVENSTYSHFEYVRCEENSYKRIAVTHCGDGLSILCQEQVKGRSDEWIEVCIAELSPQEFDAINDLIKDTEFENQMKWNDKIKKYTYRRKQNEKDNS